MFDRRGWMQDEGQVQNYRIYGSQALARQREIDENSLAVSRRQDIGAMQRRLRADPQANLEALLEEKQAEAATYPPVERELMAFRYYLQEVLGVCGDQWWTLSRSETNYGDLLSRIDRWRYAEQERIAVVTFNYDTLLDRGGGSAPGDEPREGR